MVSLGAQCTEELLVQNNQLLKFFVDDFAKENELDLSPAMMALCTIVDQTSQDGTS